MFENLQNILTPDGNFQFLLFLALAAAKATVLLSFIALINSGFRGISGATRHLLWTSALCAALLLPLLSFLNFWEVPILPARLSAKTAASTVSNGNDEATMTAKKSNAYESSISDEANAAEREKSELQTKPPFLENFSPTVAETSERRTAPPKTAMQTMPQSVNWALIVWFAGALLLLLKLFAGLAGSVVLARRGAKFKDAALNESFSALCAELNLKNKARLLCGERTSMPVVCGIFRSVVLLPAGAGKWSSERQRIVLLHELAHVARRDCLTQFLAQTTCAFYWFNPLVWLAARRLRVERERACDDRVLSVGTKPSDYAYHLLEIARSMQETRSIFEWSQTTSSVAMARRSQLEGRLLGILSEENKTGAASSRRATAGIIALVGVLLVALAVVRPTATGAQQKSAFSETISDGNKGETKPFSLDSFFTRDPNRAGETLAAARNSKIDASIKKRDTTADASINDSSELTFKDGQIEKAVEPGKTPPPTEAELSESISDAVERQIAASLPTTSQVISLPAEEVNSFVNANYRQERGRQTQDNAKDFVAEMASVGYANLSVDDLIKLKTAGATANYVRNLRALGLADLTLKEIVSMSIHNVTPEYIRALRAAGYEALPAKELTAFRIHGVTPEFIESLRVTGYNNLTAKQLTNFAVHEVTPEFIQEIRAAGYGNLQPKEIVSLRVFDITPDFIRKARSRLGELSLKQIISLKNTGILSDGNDKEDE